MLRCSFHRKLVPITLSVWLCISSGCNTPDTVSKFCSSAITAISSTTAVLADLGPSCLREINDNSYTFGSFTTPITSDSNCDRVATQANAAIAAAQLLSEYFSALNSLATVGVKSASSDARTLATDAAAIPGASADEKTAIGSLAQELATSIMSGYQYRKLAEDFPKAKNSIDNVVSALVRVIQTNYIDQLLKDEEKRLANPYKAFLGSSVSPEAKLLLDQRWRADEQTLQARRYSAKSAVAALKTLQAGFDQLADNANKIKAKDVSGLLAPYVSQLQTLIPQIQKGF